MRPLNIIKKTKIQFDIFASLLDFSHDTLRGETGGGAMA